MIIDFYTDSDMSVLKDIIHREGAHAIPDCIKSASTLVPSEEFRMEKQAFAWPHRNMFPLDTPADVWLSAQYFKKTAHLVPIQYRAMVDENIKMAAALHAVDLDLPSEKMAKVASAPVDPIEAVYGVKQASDGMITMAMGGFEQVKAANASFPRGLEDAGAYNLHMIAKGIYKAASAEGLPVSAEVEAWAQPIKRSHVVDQMTARWAHCMEANRRVGMIGNWQEKSASYVSEMSRFSSLPSYPVEAVEGYRVLAEKAASIDATELPELLAIAQTLDEQVGLDKVAGFTPAAIMNRALVDDMAPRFVKIAGFRVPMEQLRGLNELNELVPGIEPYLTSPVKMAHLVETAPEMNQKALLMIVRRIHG